MQRRGGPKSFDGRDVPVRRLHRQHGAAFHGIAVEEYGAGAALAGVAADVGTREAQLLTQHINQQGLGRDQEMNGLAVHVQIDGHHHCVSLLAGIVALIVP